MIGIICALNEEIKGLQEVMKDMTTTTKAKLTYYKGTIEGKDVVATECGMGKVNAAMSTQIMIDLFNPDVIINCGVAGSLSADIKIGDIVISTDCVQHDFDGTEMGDPLGQIQYNDEVRIEIEADKNIVDKLHAACKNLENTNTLKGRIASGDAFIANRDRRLKITGNFNALACEMEGAAVGQVCYRNGVPFAILRCISDDFSGNEYMDFLKFKPISAAKSTEILKNFIADY